MAISKNMNVDFKSIQENLQKQFSGLDPNDPSLWPSLPRNLLYIAVCIAVVAGLWFAWLKAVDEELLAEQASEQSLREDYRKKLVQAVNLDALKKQLVQVQQYVTQLEKQLPSKAEMDALLSDINQAGLGRSLQFELFRPGQVSVQEYYAELPIAVRVTGGYHDGKLCVVFLHRYLTRNTTQSFPSLFASRAVTTISVFSRLILPTCLVL